MSQSKDKSPVTLAISGLLNKSTSTDSVQLLKSRFQVFQGLNCVGYAGYIQGVKSEVVFGQTYGMTSLASKANAFHKGRDEPADLKYNTIMKQEFIDHATKKHETVAEIVGVHRQSPRFAKVS